MSDIKDLTRLDVIIPTSTYNRLVAITKKQNASLPNNVGRLLDEGIDQMYKSHPNLKTKPTALDWSKAIAETPEPVPMEAEIWALRARYEPDAEDIPSPADFSPQSVRQARESLGLTQVQAARRIGVTWITLSRWENGKTRPASPAHIRALNVLMNEAKAERKKNTGTVPF